MLKVLPHGARYVVQKLDAPTTTRSGIILAHDKMENPPCTGIVLEVGPGQFSDMAWKFMPMRFEKGDKLLFKAHGGTKAMIGEDEVFILADSDILGKIVDDEAPAK